MLILPEREDEPGLERRPTRGRFCIDRTGGYCALACRSRSGVWRADHDRDKDGVCLYCDDGKHEDMPATSNESLWDYQDDWPGWDIQMLDFGELADIE